MEKEKKVYRITEVHEKDAFFSGRERFLGKRVQPMGTLKIWGDERGDKDLIGYAHGKFIEVDPFNGPRSFYAIKLEEVIEEENQNEQS